MGIRLRHAIWNELCWLQEWFQKILKAFCAVVQGFSQNRNQSSWFHVIIQLLLKILSHLYIVNIKWLGLVYSWVVSYEVEILINVYYIVNMKLLGLFYSWVVSFEVVILINVYIVEVVINKTFFYLNTSWYCCICCRTRKRRKKLMTPTYDN